MKKQGATFLSLLVMLLCLSACSSTDCRVDNPTNAEVSISIDGKDPIIVAANEYKKIGSIDNGEHTMQVNGGEAIKFTTTGSTGLLNPSKQEYILVKQEYSISGGISDIPTKDIELDGEVYNGPFEVVSDPFIYTGDLNFQLDEPIKDEITLPKGKNSVVYTKIFRKADFISYYNEEYGEE